ncbi:solute carrier organic anion transporter family member 4A1-like [Haemaphysalis longicornis]
MQYVFIRLLGTVPSPLIFGKTVDMACQIWSAVFDGLPNEGGNCVHYNNASLSRYVAALLLLLKSMSVVLYICAGISYKKLGDDTSAVSPVVGHQEKMS